MIVADFSEIPMPGKHAEYVAARKDIVAYLDQRWPLAQPRMVTADIADGRIHIIGLWASLDAQQAALSEMRDDARVQATTQTLAPLIVPGSTRWDYRRVL